MAQQNSDPYLVLGVSPTASQAEITHAYRTRLRAHHPDTRHTPRSSSADDDLRRVLAAYNLLRDPARRAVYDQTITSAATPDNRRSTDRFDIPVTYRTTKAPSPVSVPPILRAGPTRRHR